jgi:hypothetical protein
MKAQPYVSKNPWSSFLKEKNFLSRAGLALALPNAAVNPSDVVAKGTSRP